MEIEKYTQTKPRRTCPSALTLALLLLRPVLPFQLPFPLRRRARPRPRIGLWSLPPELRYAIYEHLAAEPLSTLSCRSRAEMRACPTPGERDLAALVGAGGCLRRDLVMWMGWQYRWTGFLRALAWAGEKEEREVRVGTVKEAEVEADEAFVSAWDLYGTSRRQSASCFTLHFRDGGAAGGRRSGAALALLGELETLTLAVELPALGEATDVMLRGWCTRLAGVLARWAGRARNVTVVFVVEGLEKGWWRKWDAERVAEWSKPLRGVWAVESLCLKTKEGLTVLWEPSGRRNREVMNLS